MSDEEEKGVQLVVPNAAMVVAADVRISVTGKAAMVMDRQVAFVFEDEGRNYVIAIPPSFAGELEEQLAEAAMEAQDPNAEVGEIDVTYSKRKGDDDERA